MTETPTAQPNERDKAVAFEMLFELSNDDALVRLATYRAEIVCEVMTDKATLLALADRVEALSGPCRETDCLIYAETQIPKERAGKIDIDAPYVGWHPIDGPYQSAVEAPRYTA